MRPSETMIPPARSAPTTASSQSSSAQQVQADLAELRYKARRYDELKLELPALRYKAQRYDETKDELTLLRARAGRPLQDIWRWLLFVRRLMFVPIWLVAGGSRRTDARSSLTPQHITTRERTTGTAPPNSICILARKQLRDITRIPRMGRALSEAGSKVVVVSLRAPVRELQEMCPEVTYIEASPRPFTAVLVNAINRRLLGRRNRVERRQARYRSAIAKGGSRALGLRLARITMAPLAWLVEFARRLVFITPCAAILKKSSQGFRQAWRELAHQPSLAIMGQFASVLQQSAMTHAFAKEADRATQGMNFAVVQAHDNYALVAAARLAARERARLVYDAVEISSHRLALDLSAAERVRERLERREEARIFRRAAAIVTVGDGLADWYARQYRIPRPVVVRNCRYFWPYERDARLRADIGIGQTERLLVWCGAAYPEQGIELMIGALPLIAPSVHLAVVATFLPRWALYVKEVLPARAEALGVGGRVHLLPPRAPNDLVPYISGADIGVIPRPGQHLNNFFSMPNKFLEMIMARLPIAVSRLGDMVDVIESYEMGGVFDESDAACIAQVIDNMLDPATYARLKTNTMRAAELMTWERESAPYIETIRSLIPTLSGGQERGCEVGVPANADPAPKHGEGTIVAVDQSVTGTAAAAGELEGVSTTQTYTHARGDDHDQLIKEITKLRAAYATVIEANKELRRSRLILRDNASFFSENPMVNKFLRFSRHCYERVGELKAEAYCVHGVEALLAADAVARREGGRIYCDVIEIPSLGSRNVANSWHPTNLALMDSAVAQFLRNAHGLLTVGWTLGAEIAKYGVPVSVIPNYRYREPPHRSAQLRKLCGIGENDRLILSISTMTSGFETIIEALSLSPEWVHLATLGEFVPPAYDEKIRLAAASYGVERRVHFFGSVPYDQLPEMASGADIGLIALDPTIVNHRVALPNRFFDYLAAGLSVLTPPVPDIEGIVAQRNLGVVLDGVDAPSWARGISAALDQTPSIRANVRAAADELCWESVEDVLHATLGHATSVTFIGYNRLHRNNRTLRMMRTLRERGVRVTLCCPHEEEQPSVVLEGVKFVPTPLN